MNRTAVKLLEQLRGRQHLEGDALVNRIDAILPQTQCRQCHYLGCKPYARAIASGEADINQCPPGGTEGIHRLAALMGRKFKPLSPLHGTEKPKVIAIIDEKVCIGCTLCIQACPVDAIVGAAKQMHTVVANHCTGCELCLPPCPVDCIHMTVVDTGSENQKLKYTPVPSVDFHYRGTPLPAPRGKRKLAANAARERYEFHQFRETRDAEEKAARFAARRLTPQSLSETTAANATAPQDIPEPNSKKALIAAAMARAQQQRAMASPKNTGQLEPEQQAQIAAIETRRAAKLKTRSPESVD